MTISIQSAVAASSASPVAAAPAVPAAKGGSTFAAVLDQVTQEDCPQMSPEPPLAGNGIPSRASDKTSGKSTLHKDESDPHRGEPSNSVAPTMPLVVTPVETPVPPPLVSSAEEFGGISSVSQTDAGGDISQANTEVPATVVDPRPVDAKTADGLTNGLDPEQPRTTQATQLHPANTERVTLFGECPVQSEPKIEEQDQVIATERSAAPECAKDVRVAKDDRVVPESLPRDGEVEIDPPPTTQPTVASPRIPVSAELPEIPPAARVVLAQPRAARSVPQGNPSNKAAPKRERKSPVSIQPRGGDFPEVVGAEILTCLTGR